MDRRSIHQDHAHGEASRRRSADSSTDAVVRYRGVERRGLEGGLRLSEDDEACVEFGPTAGAAEGVTAKAGGVGALAGLETSARAQKKQRPDHGPLSFGGGGENRTLPTIIGKA